MMETCPNKKICGSCQESTLSYKKQLQKKFLLIQEAFKNHNIFPDKDLEIIPSPEISHYRNRMDYAIDYQRNVGLREKGKWWKVIDGHTCFIADKKIEEIFVICREWVKTTPLTCWDRKSFKGILRYFVIRSTKDKKVMLNVVTSVPISTAEEILCKTELEKLITICKADVVVWSVNHTNSDVSFGDELKTIHGNGFIEEEINTFKYRITPNSFFQTNPYGAKILQDVVTEFFMESESLKVLDLYCGTGFFTIPLAKRALKVYGVEVVQEAIFDAKINAKLNNCFPDFSTSKSEDLEWQNFETDLIVVDPPRAGLHPKVIKTILKKSPKNIIYISCNFKKFAEEFKNFESSYKIANLKAVDMFPQTPHVELIMYLTKKP